MTRAEMCGPGDERTLLLSPQIHLRSYGRRQTCVSAKTNLKVDLLYAFTRAVSSLLLEITKLRIVEVSLSHTTDCRGRSGDRIHGMHAERKMTYWELGKIAK